MKGGRKGWRDDNGINKMNMVPNSTGTYFTKGTQN